MTDLHIGMKVWWLRTYQINGDPENTVRKAEPWYVVNWDDVRAVVIREDGNFTQIPKRSELTPNGFEAHEWEKTGVRR